MPNEATGWKVEISQDLEKDTPPSLVTYCPECWQREFGNG
jgi:hypothetical protein